MKEKAAIFLLLVFAGSLLTSFFAVKTLEDPKIPLKPPKVKWRQEGLTLTVSFSCRVIDARVISKVPLEVKSQGETVKVILPEKSLKEYLSKSFSVPCTCSLPFTLEAVLSGHKEACLYFSFQISLFPPKISGDKAFNPNPLPLTLRTTEGTFQVPPRKAVLFKGSPVSFELLGKSFWLTGVKR